MNENVKKVLFGFLYAFIGALLVALYQTVSAGEFPSTWAEWKIDLLVGLSAGLASLITNVWPTDPATKSLKSQSQFMSINFKDLIISFLYAAVGAIILIVYQAISNGELPSNWVEWRPVILAGVSAGLAVIIQKYFTNSGGVANKKERLY